MNRPVIPFLTGALGFVLGISAFSVARTLANGQRAAAPQPMLPPLPEPPPAPPPEPEPLPDDWKLTAADLERVADKMVIDAGFDSESADGRAYRKLLLDDAGVADEALISTARSAIEVGVQLGIVRPTQPRDEHA